MPGGAFHKDRLHRPSPSRCCWRPCFSKLPACGEPVGYADNFLAMAKDANDVVSMTVAFWSALKAHPAGQLRPKEPRIFRAWFAN